jgi:hypothetical protein
MLVFLAAPAWCSSVVVESTYASANQLLITGSDFEPGSTAPTVNLDNNVLVVVSFTNTKIVATLPAGLHTGFLYHLGVTNSVGSAAASTVTLPGVTGYGDGSDGNVTISGSADWTVTPPSGSQQFTNFTVASGAVLKVPSGLIIRATGQIEIAGQLTVAPGTVIGRLNTLSTAPGALQAAQIVTPNYPGFGEYYTATYPPSNGGGAGGSIVLRAALGIAVTGTISASGDAGQDINLGYPGTTSGAGGGGTILLMSSGQISVSGTMTATGGDGAPGFLIGVGNGIDVVAGPGGGGGIIHLFGPTAQSTPCAACNVSGGNPGVAGPQGAGECELASAASNGSGGLGGAVAATSPNNGIDPCSVITPSQPGSAGFLLFTQVADPSTLLL